MKILIWIALVLLSGSALAGDVVVSFDQAGTSAEMPVAAFQTVDVYVIGQDVGQVLGWEMAITFPSQYTVLERNFSYGGIIIDPPDYPNYLIGLGECRGIPSTDFLFVHFRIGYFLTDPIPLDETICISPTPEATPPYDGSISYLNCDSQRIVMPLGNIGCTEATNGCAILNPSSACVIASEQRSWSSVKADF